MRSAALRCQGARRGIGGTPLSLRRLATTATPSPAERSAARGKVLLIVGASVLVGVVGVVGVGGYVVYSRVEKQLASEGFVHSTQRRGTGASVTPGEEVTVRIVELRVVGGRTLIPRGADEQVRVVVGGQLPEGCAYGAELVRLVRGMKHGERATAIFLHGDEKLLLVAELD